MNLEQFLLTKLAEECSEVAQIALKSQQFGLDEVYGKIGVSNRQRVYDELNDLLGVVGLLNEIGFGYSPDEEAMQAKKVKVREYLEYSRDLGKVY